MSVLDEILEGVRADLEERQSRVSLEHLKDQVRKAPSPLDAATMWESLNGGEDPTADDPAENAPPPARPAR